MIGRNHALFASYLQHANTVRIKFLQKKKNTATTFSQSAVFEASGHFLNRGMVKCMLWQLQASRKDVVGVFAIEEVIQLLEVVKAEKPDIAAVGMCLHFDNSADSSVSLSSFDYLGNFCGEKFLSQRELCFSASCLTSRKNCLFREISENLFYFEKFFVDEASWGMQSVVDGA